jgi:dipeptidase D
MGRVLSAILKELSFNLVEIVGGSKDNAIPRECKAKLAISKGDADRAMKIVKKQFEAIKDELSDADKNVKIEAAVLGDAVECLDSETTRKAVYFMNVVANGVLQMSHDIKDLVEYSRNLGVVLSENGRIDFVLSSRSSTESLIDQSQGELDSLCSLLGGEIAHYSRYPGWKFEKDSELRESYIKAASKVFGREPVIMAIHAGLECGIIKSHINNMAMISIGPEMRDIHSPDEALDLPSCERFWLIIEEMLKA